MTLFSEFLKVLKVPHTQEYADNAFRNMNFQSLFGFSRLLESYGISSQGIKVKDKSQLPQMPLPFLAQEGSAFVVVTSVCNGEVSFIKFDKQMTLPLEKFEEDWTGIALLAVPEKGAKEPDYKQHHFHEIAMKGLNWVMVLAALFLGVYGFIWSGIGHHLSLIFLLAVNLAGIGVTWLLLLKTLKVKSSSADKICGVLQEHGCDSVLANKAAKFMGLFGWSEVGFTYFTLSTLFLFLFPQQIHWLALINGLCLPFTVWSISYQKFKLHTWCTLCVITQSLLWLQFLCYILGGWWTNIFPLQMPLFLMGAAYVAGMLALNNIINFINKKINGNN